MYGAGFPSLCLIVLLLVVSTVFFSSLSVGFWIFVAVLAAPAAGLCLSRTVIEDDGVVWGIRLLLTRRLAFENVERFVVVEDMVTIRGLPATGIAAVVAGREWPVKITTSVFLGNRRRQLWLDALESHRQAATA